MINLGNCTEASQSDFCRCNSGMYELHRTVHIEPILVIYLCKVSDEGHRLDYSPPLDPQP